MKRAKNAVRRAQIEAYGSYSKDKSGPRYQKVWEYLFSKKERGNKLLDIGCADGAFSAKLVRKGFDCYGLEIVGQAIQDSRQSGLKVTRGSFLDPFPFKRNFFDYIFAGEVIEHTLDDDGFLSECWRVLKPGGLLILTTPNLVSLGNRLLMLLGKLPRFVYAPFHYKIYTPTLICSKLMARGFNVRKLEANYVLISTVYNPILGWLGEKLGLIFPQFGECLIIYAEK